MRNHGDLPTVVLICHEEDLLDREGLASWLANTTRLAGLLIIRDEPGRLWRAAQREMRRVGVLKFLDVVAFRAYARFTLRERDEAWKKDALARLRSTYSADLAAVPQVVVSSPNSAAAREFLQRLQPDLAIARCKMILKREIFEVPRVGTFVLHPGICPEYRNAHGCFWALAQRDMDRVGMTLLRVDPGIDTGPVYLQATCDFDEVADSHTVIQYRAVFDNLDAIGRTLIALSRGEDVRPVSTAGRRSATWGQPRLTEYLKWKRAARRDRRAAAGRLRRTTEMVQ
jgi:folate-dependent phosphoribosylglycinamide formyltransferase PurN